MNILNTFFYSCIFLFFISCKSSNTLLTNLNRSGYLSINHYSSSLPTLGPCGFLRKFETYSILTPRINGKIESKELRISTPLVDTLNNNYTGYIEFINKNTVYIDLYSFRNGVKIALTINGSRKIKIEVNKIGDKRI